MSPSPQVKEIRGSAEEFLQFVGFLEQKYPDSVWLRPGTAEWISTASFQTQVITLLVHNEEQVIAALIGMPYTDDEMLGKVYFKTYFLFVDPDFQGKGVASGLLERLKNAYDGITLHASSTGINKMQKTGMRLDGFYFKNGFRSYDDDGNEMWWYKRKDV